MKSAITTKRDHLNMCSKQEMSNVGVNQLYRSVLHAHVQHRYNALFFKERICCFSFWLLGLPANWICLNWGKSRKMSLTMAHKKATNRIALLPTSQPTEQRIYDWDRLIHKMTSVVGASAIRNSPSQNCSHPLFTKHIVHHTWAPTIFNWSPTVFFVVSSHKIQL